MFKNKILLLLLACFLLVSCENAFDYRHKFVGTFDVTYRYHFQWSGGVIDRFMVERDTVEMVDDVDEIQFSVGGAQRQFVVDKLGDLYLYSISGSGSKVKVGSYDKAEDSITFVEGKANLGDSFDYYDDYYVGAKRVK